MKLVTLAILAIVSFSSIAGTSDDLKLKGKVHKKLSIQVTADPIAMQLDLETTQTALPVAVVNERSNSNTGYKITADSLNDGKLVNQQDTTQSITYSMMYGTHSVNLGIVDEVKKIEDSGVHNNDTDVTIAYTGALDETRVEGNYTDTVTFTISAN